jgi:hypothetical protein
LMICDRYSFGFFANRLSIIIFRPCIARTLKNTDEFHWSDVERMCRPVIVARYGGGSCRRLGIRSGWARWAYALNYGTVCTRLITVRFGSGGTVLWSC